MQLKRLTKELKLKHEKCNQTRQQAKGNWFCKGRALEGKEKKKKKERKKEKKKPVNEKARSGQGRKFQIFLIG